MASRNGQEVIPGAGGQSDIEFYHPYTPYDVQLQFMRTIYDILERGEGQVGILESPTGTGKSLSLICSSLTWLRNFKRGRYESSLTTAAEEYKHEPKWVVDQVLQRHRDELARKWEEREQRLADIRAKERVLEERAAKRQKIQGVHRVKNKEADSDEDFLLAEGGDDTTDDNRDPMSSFTKETRALMERAGLIPSTRNAEEEEVEEEIKIYYASRTHSQLTQFISELRRPAFPSSLPLSVKSPDSNLGHEGLKHIPLSARQKLCINPDVAKLGSAVAINDRCAELTKPKSKEKCPYAPRADNASSIHQFRDTALATLPDIEDLYQIGSALHVCPYYASRAALPAAEIITLPYPLLLQQSAREALGIKLEGNIVIIDEAHNIMDAVANVHAAELCLADLQRARGMLVAYVKRFGRKLKGENRVMVGQLGRVVEGLLGWMEAAKTEKADQGIVDAGALLKHKGADQVNLFELIKYIQMSKLAFKVEGYAAHVEEQDGSASRTSSGPVLHSVAAFLLALTNLSNEGRIFFERSSLPSPGIKLSYLLLSPTHAFSSVASSARAVILAGGTMSPFDDYKAHLFPGYVPSKITTLSCGHVIPASSLCVWTLGSFRPAAGSQADSFEFSFRKRGDHAMIQKLGTSLLNICAVVPDGVVVFFPSYGYLDEVVQVWQSPDGQGNAKSVWNRLLAKKAIFQESKAAATDSILDEYGKAILGDPETATSSAPASGPRGALLLSVVGGKMSEGINFSDRLGRCVVIVGLPYPNINSPEWKARIEYIEATTVARLTPAADPVSNPEQTSTTRDATLAEAKQAARDFYENACMRAVNQSIGRAIRHRGDYAAIILVDRRFGTDRIRGKLPRWIRSGMVKGSEDEGVQGLMGALNGFFRGKREGSFKA